MRDAATIPRQPHSLPEKRASQVKGSERLGIIEPKINRSSTIPYRTKKGGHLKAARYCSFVNPRVRPVAISSIRRMPSRTASFRGSGVTTLSTKRRASSSRSSGGSSKGLVAVIRKHCFSPHHKASWDSPRWIHRRIISDALADSAQMAYDEDVAERRVLPHFPFDNLSLHANISDVRKRHVQAEGDYLTGGNGGNGEGNDEFLISVISVFSCSIAYIRISIELVNIAIFALRRRLLPRVLSHFGANRHKCLCMKHLHTKWGVFNRV